jgi:hypothetical protein
MRTTAQRLAQVEANKARRTYGERIDQPAVETPPQAEPLETALGKWYSAQRQRLVEIDAKGGARAIREQLRGDSAYIAALDDYANAVRKMTWDGKGDPPDFGPMPAYR